MADWDTTSSDSPPTRADSSSPEVLSEIIAAQPQPDDATHFSLPGEEYLAEGDVRATQHAQRDEGGFGSTPPPTRVYTRTVNLEVAHMRLQNILAETDDEHSQRYSVFVTGIDEETRKLEEDVYLRREHMSINWLRERQVPLLYDPKFLPQVLSQPERYAGLVRPFYLHPPIDFDAPEINFFERQALRFEEFTRWQSYNRGLDLRDEKLMIESYEAALVREAKSAREWQQLMANPSLAHSAGRKDEFWDRRREERELLHDDKCSSFEEYQAGVCARLARNGVQVHRGFALLNEFWAQDRLTMWTEYLAFEHWHKEQYDDDVDEWRAKHDTSYEQLQGKVALRVHETPAYLQTEEARMERRVEKDRAENRFDTASLAFARLERRPRGLSHEQMYMTHIRRTRMLAEAQGEVEAAGMAKKREACDIRARHDALLDWAKDQYWEIRADAGHLAVVRREPAVLFGQSQVILTEDDEASQRTDDAGPVALSEQQAAVAEAEAGAMRQDEEKHSCTGPSSEAPLPPAALQTPALASPPVSLPPVASPHVSSPDVPPLVPPSVPRLPVETLPEEPGAGNSSLKEPQFIEEHSVEQALVKEADAKRPLNQPSPSRQSEADAPVATPATGLQDQPASQTTVEATAATPAPAPPLEPRRSARIAGLRQKAAEKAAAKKAAAESAQSSATPKSLPKKRRAVPPKAALAKAAPAKGAKPKRRRGKATEEHQEAHNAEPPAKRTRRRTAKQ